LELGIWDFGSTAIVILCDKLNEGQATLIL